MTILKKITVFTLITLFLIPSLSMNAAFAATSPTEETPTPPESQSAEDYYESQYNDPHHNDAYFGTYSCNISEMVEALSDHPQGGWYIRGAN